MKQKIINFLTFHKFHILIWSIYIVYESIVTGFFAGVFGPLINYVVHYALNISLFYINAALISRIRLKGGPIAFIKYIILIASEISLYTILLALLNNLFTSYNQSLEGNFLGIDHKFILGATYRSLFFIMVSSGYAFLVMFLSERKKSELLRIKNLEDIIARRTAEASLISTQNAFLRAQINPHLFFNVLSFVHRRIRKVDEIAGDMLISLCDVMRYAADASPSSNLTKLNDEVIQIKTLSRIFKLLEGEKFNFTINYDQKAGSLMVLPLILITLVENMYKHGNLSNPNDPGVLSIYIEDDQLKIRTKNPTFETPRSASLGTGLKNLNDRLESIYGNKVSMATVNDDGRYIVSTSITLT